MTEAAKFSAFLSYSHHDKSWGDWLHRALESYRVPRKVVGTAGYDGPIPKRLLPIFRDREELSASANLGDQIKTALEQSSCLIVICSPHSATSKWVNEEILFFKRMGRENRILAIIVEGEPNTSDKAGVDPALECFPPGLRFRIDSNGQLSDQRTEPIAGDAREQGDGKTNAKLKVIAGMLGVNYDTLKRREETRQAIRRLVATSVTAAVLSASALYAWQIYNRGLLVADSDTPSSSIRVDDMELGSRVRMPLETGKHELMASAPDYFDLHRTISVQRGKTTTTQFWLERGFEWEPYTSPSIQSSLVLIPGKDDTILVHNETTRIIFLSTTTGSIISSFNTPLGTKRTFVELDLGGEVGKVIVSALDAERSGPEVLVIKSSSAPEIMWRWNGPTSGFNQSTGLSVAAVPTHAGVAQIAVAGRDGHIYFLDGKSGKQVGDVVISSKPLWVPPTLAVLQEGGDAHLTVLMRLGDPDAPPANSKSFQGMTLSLSDRSVIWRNDLGEPWYDIVSPLQVDGVPQILLWNNKQWQMIDSNTGKVRGSGDLPGRLLGNPGFAQIEGLGTLDLVFEFADPSLPMLAVRPADSAILWRGPKGLSSRGQPRAPDNTLLHTPDGNLLVYFDDALAAVDPHDGHIAWKIVGQPISSIVGDWNGDGRDEILVTMRNVGLLCLDGAGHLLWTLRMDKEVSPWGLVAPPLGGSTRNILVLSHASMIGVVHGPRVNVLWRNTASAAFQSTPVVAKTENHKPVVVEIATWGNDVFLRAFNGAEGNVRWSAHEAFYQNRGAALADLDGNGAINVVALGRRSSTEGIHLLAYRPSDGHVMRSVAVTIKGVAIKSWLSCVPAIADFRGIGKSDVAFNTWDDRMIVMVEGRTGEVLWHQKTDAENMGGIAAADLDGDGHPDVVASSFDGFIYGLRGKDGKLLWKAPIEFGGWSTPVVAHLDGSDSAHVLVISQMGRLYVLDARTGAEQWTTEAGGGKFKVTGHPIVVQLNGRMIILAPLGALGVVAYDWTSSTEIWRSPIGYPVIASPVLADFGGGKNDSVVVAATTGHVWVLNLADGTPIWGARIVVDPKADPENPKPLIEADPVVDDLDGDGISDILIAGYDFTLHALSGVTILAARK